MESVGTTEKSDTGNKEPLRKGILSIIFFIISIAAVTAILTYKKQFSLLVLTGTGAIVTFCFAVLYLFLLQFRREVLSVLRKIIFILLAVVALLLATRYITDIQGRDLLFLIPFAIIPVVIRTFYDARLALFTHLITIMLAGFLVPEPFEFIFLNFLTGMVAIFTLKNIYRKTRLFFTALMVFVSYSVLYLGLGLMQDGEISMVLWSDIKLFAGNAILVLLSYPLIFIFEMEFLFLSDNTLLELADTSQPLLRKLAVEAPGSFQHSLQVANLAEEAARVLGLNILLVRTGALYHDIGKIACPGYYIENQADGISPHENMNPKESSKIIINHVKNGVVLAKNYKLPVQIIDFIRTHHGTTVAFYFYKKFIDQNPGTNDMEKEFSYPGPKPFSKETAVVMMADAVEASSRSLTSYDDISIGELVERIIYLQEQDGQFANVPLTFRDMSDIKTAFKKRLSNMYHTRVAYPDRD